jgi:predicted flap endonuclease-1-like 5' DNA nuclease
MKGDFTRLTFDRDKHYSAVHLQQGRVALDADWNEQVAIDAYLRETALADLVGKTGAPQTGGGFEVLVAPGGRDLLLTPGRYYVDGTLCELASEPVVPFRLSGSGQPVNGGSVPVEALDAATAVDRRLAPDPTSFNVNLSLGDFHRLGLAPGDSVKLLFLDPFSSREIELGPYKVLRIATVQSDRIDVTLEGNPAEGMGPPRLRRETSYLHQPHLPGSQLPTREGTYLVYLDVWKRHLTALEDPGIREVALGGPDTATRTQTVCQVKLFEVTGATRASSSFCILDPEGWTSHIAPSSGRLLARTSPSLPTADPCVVPADAGYTMLENQLYRVEVHLGSDAANGPTFKWSRDNGTVLTAWLEPDAADVTDPTRIKVASLGRDEVLGFQQGQWIELTDDRHELEGRPGLLVKIAGIQGETLIVDSLGQTVKRTDFPLNPKVRRWDHPPTAGKDGVAATAGGWIPLEGGLEVAFDFDLGGTLRTGDYWLIPARAFIGEHRGSIEWPQDSQGDPLALFPQGIEHRYARLAVVDFRSFFLEAELQPAEPAPSRALKIDLPQDSGRPPFPTFLPTFSGLTDCRPLFPPLTDLLQLVPCCKCDQEALPGEALPELLRATVILGKRPVPNAGVRFSIDQGGGTLLGKSETGSVVTEITDGDGEVSCGWQLGPRYEPQRVTAILVEPAEGFFPWAPFGATVCLTARQSLPVLHIRCGEGQEARPGQEVPADLEVAVEVGGRPIPKPATVRFKVISNASDVRIPTTGGSDVTLFTADASEKRLPGGGPVWSKWVDAPTDLASGVARCRLRLGPGVRAQQVEASLAEPAFLDPDGNSMVAPVCFTSTLSTAAEVSYDPAACKVLQDAGAVTVQKAIDELCKRLPPPVPPRFFVENVRLATGAEILNDSLVEARKLASGIAILCTKELAPEPFGGHQGLNGPPGFNSSFPDSLPNSLAPKPVLQVTLDLPWRPEATSPVVAFQPLQLQALVSVSGRTISWRPTKDTSDWLESLFVQPNPVPATGSQSPLVSREIGTTDVVPASFDALRVRLTLKGNFVWTPDKDGQPAAYLAGEALGRPAPGERVDLVRTPLPPEDFVPFLEPGIAVDPLADPSRAAAAAPIVSRGFPPILQREAVSGNRAIAGTFEMWFWIVSRVAVLATTVRGNNVAGNVKDESGAPLSGFKVQLLSDAGALPRTQLTEVTGQFHFQGLTLAGTYTVRVNGTAARKQVTVSASVAPPDQPQPPLQAAAARAAASPSPPEPALADVRGIGPVALSRLQQASITRVGQVAAMEPAQLAEILGVSETRAKTLVENARFLTRKGTVEGEVEKPKN